MHQSPSIKSSVPGFLGYLTVLMWLLMTILNANEAHAEEFVDAPTPQPTAIMTPQDILPEIETALIDHGLAPDADISFANPDQRFTLVVGPAPITHVSYSPRSGRFVVRLAGAGQPVSIAGVAKISERLPVLHTPKPSGDVILETDITYVEKTIAHANGYVMDAGDLIGMAARRPLRAETPLRASDVTAPVLVKKGALITLSYNIEGLRLTHQGLALSNGGKGEVISIRNIKSDRILKGVIEGENFVRIAAPHRVAPSGKS